MRLTAVQSPYPTKSKLVYMLLSYVGLGSVGIFLYKVIKSQFVADRY